MSSASVQVDVSSAVMDNLPGLAAMLLPVLVLAAYELGTTSSLKAYLAVEQLADAPAAVDDETKAQHKRKRRRRLLLALALVALVWGGEGYIIAIQDFDLLNTLVTGFFAVAIGLASSSFWQRVLDVPQAVYRLPNGFAHFRTYRKDRKTTIKVVGAHILAGASTYLVFTNLYSQTVALLSIAILVSRLTSAGMGKLSSIRKLTIAFIGYEAAIIALSLVMVWLAAKKPDMFGDSDSPFPIEGAGDESEKMMMRAHSIVIPAIYAVPVGQYIAACARFDLAQAKKAGFVAMEAAGVLEEVPAFETRCMPLTSSGRLVPGMALGIRDILPGQFRHYYKLAFRVAAGCYLVIAPMVHAFAANLTSGKQAEISSRGSGGKAVFDVASLEHQLFALTTMFITVPILAIAVGIKAKCRGEKKDLWTYNEVWFKKPADAGQTGESSATTLESAPLLEKPTIVIEEVDVDTKN